MTGTAVEQAWHGAGCPEPNWQGKAKVQRKPPEWRQGTCALLGHRGPVVDLRHVLSDLFTGWDRLPHQHARDCGFSEPAAWAFRERIAMQQPHGLIDGQWRQLDPPGLCQALELLASSRAQGIVTVPQSRQKHLLPYARTGHVRVDDECLRWAAWDGDRLAVYGQLRTLGFGEAALAEPEPRWVILRRLNREAAGVVMGRWHDLDPWRAHPAYLDVAARATRTPKETDG